MGEKKKRGETLRGKNGRHVAGSASKQVLRNIVLKDLSQFGELKKTPPDGCEIQGRGEKGGGGEG